jgi:regulator of replication initiation timing
VRSLDFQDADKLAERLEKMLPPGIANDKRGPQAQIAQLTQQLQQLQQESQQHIEEGLKLEEENAKLKAGEAATMAQTQQKVQAYAVDQQLARDKANADVQLKRDQIAADEAIKRAQAVADAQLAQDQADAQAALAKYKIDMDATAKKYAADVARETDLAIAAENERIAAEKPEESEEKTITIKAPSGGTYTGTVKKSAISIKAPSGTYTGTIQ